jgi:hypothetical protein
VTNKEPIKTNEKHFDKNFNEVNRELIQKENKILSENLNNKEKKHLAELEVVDFDTLETNLTNKDRALLEQLENEKNEEDKALREVDNLLVNAEHNLDSINLEIEQDIKNKK